MAPQIIFIVLISLSVLLGLLNHGKPKGEYNFYTDTIAAALTAPEMRLPFLPQSF
jgi:hypothetical protein